MSHNVEIVLTACDYPPVQLSNAHRRTVEIGRQKDVAERIDDAGTAANQNGRGLALKQLGVGRRAILAR